MKNHVLYILGYLACILCSYPNGVSVSVDGLDYPTKKRKVETASRQTNRQVWRVGNIRLDPQSANDETPDLKTNDSNSGESKLKAIPSDGVGSARMMTGGRNLLQQKIWNRLDAMDKMIVGNTLPLVGLTSIVPIVSSIDLFWVNQLGDALSVSAQSAANTVYQFSFGLFSFLPSVTATLSVSWYRYKERKSGSCYIREVHEDT
ncbi:unnamed protein product [Pseudo-nitzschia multistriata]|uniref:Uncharacterized protein n=1 Tax=Pseudo-nitzschia multistriata TaxID=183589 RepID=A0A448Z6P6_9STRA|nr:unnamed protein product [Pseudo-nitzschia multistriata]